MLGQEIEPMFSLQQSTAVSSAACGQQQPAALALADGNQFNSAKLPRILLRSACRQHVPAACVSLDVQRPDADHYNTDLG